MYFFARILPACPDTKWALALICALCSVTLQLCNEKYTIVPHMLFQEETAMQQNESRKHTKAPYFVRVIPPSKNAAQENADRIRCGKMLGRLMQLSEEMQGRESPKKRRI